MLVGGAEDAGLDIALSTPSRSAASNACSAATWSNGTEAASACSTAPCVRPRSRAGRRLPARCGACRRAGPYIDKDAPPERPGYPQILRGEPRLPDSTPGEGITLDRFHARRTMLRQFDDQVRRAEGHPALATLDSVTQARAFELLTSAKVKACVPPRRRRPQALRHDRLRPHALRLQRPDRPPARRGGRPLRQRDLGLLLGEAATPVRLLGHGARRNFPILREYNLPQLDLTLSGSWETSTVAGCWTRPWWSS